MKILKAINLGSHAFGDIPSAQNKVQTNFDKHHFSDINVSGLPFSKVDRIKFYFLVLLISLSWCYLSGRCMVCYTTQCLIHLALRLASQRCRQSIGRHKIKEV